MKKIKSYRVFIGFGILIMLFISTVVFSEPGSEKNPLVTLSYLEKRIEQLRYYIDEKTSNLDENPQRTQSNNLEVVNMVAGQSIIGENGTEIILRSGKATIIATQLGGLCDVTAGKDLKSGELTPPNHLLIIPRDDGRGVKAVNDIILLVRGEYQFK